VSDPHVSIHARSLAPRVLEWRIDNQARRNAVAPDDLRWIAQQASTLDGEIVVLTGDGEAAFCAGFDLKSLATATEATPDLTLMEATNAMAQARAVFIAAVAGPAVGAGVELAAACDFRVAHARATFRVPAGRLGVVYHAEGLARLHAVFGGALTRRMLLAGATVDAEEAAAVAGAVDELVPAAADVGERARAMASRISQLAPLSVHGNRRLLRALDLAALPDELLRAHDRARAEAYASEDHAEARAAVSQRRDPKFAGR